MRLLQQVITREKDPVCSGEEIVVIGDTDLAQVASLPVSKRSPGIVIRESSLENESDP